MASEIFQIKFCDYPGCRDTADHMGQETQTVSFWFYVNGKGRKTNPVQVDMCEEHSAEMRGLFTALQKFNQKD